MSTQPLGAPRVRYFDSNGNPLSGGKLYTYSAGTTTPLSTYTTRAGTIANANPVVLDANGEADVWMTSGALYKFVLKDSSDVTQWTVDNYPAPAEASASTDEAAVDPGGRLTLQSGAPIAEVSNGTSLYYAPYFSDKVPLYDGTSWALYSIGSGLSQLATDNTKSPAASAVNSNYDVFVWNDSGTVRLSRGPAWTSDSARGTGVGTTELTQINGRHVNANAITNGPGAQRGLYVGTVRTDGGAQFNDLVSARCVWNRYRQVRRRVLVTDLNGGVGWASGSANTWRQVRANSANVVALVRGLNEDAVELQATLYFSGASGLGTTGIGLNSTTVNSAVAFSTAAPGANQLLLATYAGLPGLGFVQAYWLELCDTGALATAFAGGDVGAVTYATAALMGWLLV